VWSIDGRVRCLVGVVYWWQGEVSGGCGLLVAGSRPWVWQDEVSGGWVGMV
jgi:hypothetical protein